MIILIFRLTEERRQITVFIRIFILPPRRSKNLPSFAFASMTDIGRKRSKNQDAIAFDSDLGLFVVADGMGGHLGGEIASQLACDTIFETFANNPEASPEDRLAQSISSASAAVFLKSTEDENLHGMGTTVTAVYLTNDSAFLGNVGDSRTYLLNDQGLIWQLTKDHSLVQERISLGQISRQEAKTDKLRNVILRSVGVEATVKVDVFTYQYEPGQLFLLCSDGLSGRLDDQEIAKAVDVKNLPSNSSELEKALQERCEQLIHFANEGGGDDNISVILVKPL